MKKKGKAQQDGKQHLRFLTVGQTARILGISPSTLHLWEDVGLITPARSSGRFRLYTPELLDVPPSRQKERVRTLVELFTFPRGKRHRW